MKLTDKLGGLGRVPELTRGRMAFALGVAMIADGLQILLLPISWTFLDEILDVIAMALIWRAIGFHILLLPTFIVEIMPIAEMLPTWTGCVVAVIALRKQDSGATASASETPPPPPIIDIEVTKTRTSQTFNPQDL
ncbi:MAG: hypothetical protein IH623_23940 [Verrucomicrobia bacterium]|nr:hypothetical protein [Verrucomicrobiota bacterium]